ncbi:Holliday junction resolvase RuvX [Candidatus Pacebacteria bacterium]|nr:Holliday junction resolvase RuvX [Candidatus Paceibacterota bacterium]
MRKMGIDYGSKRVGIAFSDDQGLMAFPHDVLTNDNTLLAEILNLIKEKEVDEIVIGYSLGRDGKPNEIHTSVEELMNDLTLQVGLPIHLEPEQYTTQEATRFQGKTEKTDAAAAAIILNSFITRAK